MTFDMPFATISALIRHGLTTGGGALMSSGLIDAAQAESLIGAGMTMAGIAWSIGRKWLRKQRTGSPN